MDQGTVPATVDARKSWLAVEIGSAPIPVDMCLCHDGVDLDVDSIDEHKDAVFIMASGYPIAEVLGSIEFLVNPDVYKKLVAVVG